ncbi:LysR family transcriptional regulator [Devosia sp. J2-20]|jgi:LysR family transcriptional regulator, regulator of abg operon|uniref:LysR family transcriptional regulator n=1 Tax=Devosia litorisediminis TaxID=2829817 RepID=A0A942EAS3_9HYPH|nr:MULTISPECIES: LysR family transcriptional regulator [Devosia]MBS3850472.1 LysR family transcriptional regulator [Devosia litorisediminis]MCZ4347853.1 LysR family transcriptional regulator [Devosia neptuniae]WDR00222.1 LysR family transcriptional regulator [Devosia sp. J2-20]|tara:strand:- start:3399 stop:4322 length:924 start_codon:yes stop_codon:yes gene_type:complete
MDKLLNQFLAVAEAGTISGAATALFITQPTLTFNMRKLEESMGVPLLTRSSRGVELTAYGETLYQNARLMRRLHDNMLKAIEQQRGRIEQGLNIGTGYSWWNLFIRDMVVGYSNAFPNARVHISLGNQLRLMDQLLTGDISLFVGHEIEGLNRSAGARFIPLSKVGNGYFVRAGHPLLAAPRSIAEIEMYPAVTSALPETRHQRFFETWSRTTAASANFDRGKYAFASNSMAACLDYVARTDAVIGHTEVMDAEFVRRGLARVTVTETTAPSVIGMYALNERLDEPRVAELISWLQEAAKAVLPPLD